jgi:DNA-binding response OmpR family regulator
MTREQQRNLLLVDDDEVLLDLLEGVLKSEGYTISIATGGALALEMIKKNKYDLILLDIKMQTVNGYSVLKFVKENYTETKVVMLTAFGDIKHALVSKMMGADAFIEKPPVRDELILTIKDILARDDVQADHTVNRTMR